MTKFDQAQYLVNVLAIMDSKRQAGIALPGNTLGTEYTKVYDEFIGNLKKEHENATRPKPKLDGRPEGGTQERSDQRTPGSDDRHRATARNEHTASREGTGIIRPGS